MCVAAGSAGLGDTKLPYNITPNWKIRGLKREASVWFEAIPGLGSHCTFVGRYIRESTPVSEQYKG